jgi:hypothetical protein
MCSEYYPVLSGTKTSATYTLYDVLHHRCNGSCTGFRPAITAVAEDATTTSTSSDDVILSNQATLSNEAAVINASDIHNTNSGGHSDSVPPEHVQYLTVQQRLAAVKACQHKPHLHDRPKTMIEIAEENKS